MQMQALRLRTDNEVLVKAMSSWISRLLMGASSLHTLDYDVENLPCPLSLRHPPLKHLSLIVAGDHELMNSLENLNHCQHLESLSILTVQRPSQIRQGTFPEIPRIDLRSATQLQHVQLVNFAPGKGEGIALPQGCALRLNAPAMPIQRWSESGVAGREAVTAMCVWPTENPVGRPWPEGLADFTALQLLELNCLHLKEALDLSAFCHIPCVKICSRDRMAAHIPKGSWQLLELEGRRWKVTFADVHSPSTHCPEGV